MRRRVRARAAAVAGTAVATAAVLAALLASLVPGSARAQAACTWESVGEKYGIDPRLLYAIAKTESNLNPAAMNRANRNGSVDIGMMQINSSWLPTLARYGITERHLLDPCTSLEVGAWILAHNMRRLGPSWDAVGAYNAASADKRAAYARKVYDNLAPLQAPQGGATP